MSPRSMVTSVLDLLAPSRCLACRRRGPMPWCPDCAPGPSSVAARCRRCGARLVEGGELDCPLADGAVARVIAAHDYGGSVAAAIRVAKLDGCPRAYPPLAVELACAVQAAGESGGVDLVTAVPVATRRRRRRGFDHAGILGRVVADELGLTFRPTLEVRGRAIDRGAGGPDVGVTRMVVSRQVSGHVLLVDDVVTTGATVRAAARRLLDAGVDRVTVAALARAGGHAPPAARPATGRAAFGGRPC